MPRRKRPSGGKPQARKAARGRKAPRSPRPADGVLVPSSSRSLRERDVFVPDAFIRKPESVPLDHRAPVEPEVYVPPSFGVEEEEVERPRRGLDIEVIREYELERERTGFDHRGACRFGCEGMLSIIGRVRPPVAMHDVICPYWDTPEGIKDMKALERQHD